MNPFLKKEWEDTKIPDHVYAQARRRAWEKLHARRRQAGMRLALAGAIAAVLLLLFLTPGADLPELPSTPRPVVSAPAEPPVSQPPSGAVSQPDVPLSEQAVQLEPESSPEPRREPSPAEEEPKRLVLNFQLPETGVTMIWIMDKDFKLGGTK